MINSNESQGRTAISWQAMIIHSGGVQDLFYALERFQDEASGLRVEASSLGFV